MHSKTTKRGWTAMTLAVAFLTACSSESPTAPEPELKNSGTFFAVADKEKVELFRTLKALRIEGDNILFTTLYDVAPASFDEARAIAKQAHIPVREALLVFSETQVLTFPLEVVWFRTLTQEEEKRAP